MTDSRLYTTVNVSNSPEYKPSRISVAFLQISLKSLTDGIPFSAPQINDVFEEGEEKTYTHTTDISAGESLENFGARSVVVDIESLKDSTDSSTKFELMMSVEGISANGQKTQLGSSAEEVNQISGDTSFTVEFYEAEPFHSYAITISITVKK